MVELPVDRVFFRDDARKINKGTVGALMDSIAEVGIINPLRVRPIEARDGLGDAWQVTAGGHRLEAARKLGLVSVPCEVVTEDDLHAELAMIDENLCRADLGETEKSIVTNRRKAIYLELHPETAAGVAGGLGNRTVANSATVPSSPSFVKATMAVTGKSERVVQLAAERGAKIAPDVLNKVKGTGLDKGFYLDDLKKLSHEKQRAKVDRDLAAPAPQRRKLFVAADPLGDEESVEKQVARLMSAWNSAGPEARESFLAKIDTAVMDKRFGS